MAGSKSDYFENALLDYVFRNTSLGLGGSLYIALFTVAPTDSTPGTEVSGGSYARSAVARSAGGWAAPSGGSINPVGSVPFPQASAPWGTVVAFAVMDAASGGNQLYWGDLTAPKAVDTGDTAFFANTSLTVTES